VKLRAEAMWMRLTIGTKFAIVATGVVLGCALLFHAPAAQAADLATSTTSTTPTTSTTAASPTTALDKQLFGPEVWRLPPTIAAPPGAPDANATIATPAPAPVKLPTALTLAPSDSFPPPPSKDALPPTINMPMTLPPAQPQKLWDGSFDLGLDGSNGNSETFNIRFGFHAKRKTEQTILTLGVDYLEQTSNSVATANRLFAEDRYEWLFEDSRWSCFIHNTVEYDEFQDYHVRDAGDLGMGYRFIRDSDTTLVGRFGGGYSHYYGGIDNGQYFPEGVFGLSLERKISKRQKFIGSIEYAPDVADFGRYRIRTQAAIEVLLDEELNLSMKIGVLDRYTSLQKTARGNDIDYAALILWKF
jgi:hypothetical protein